MESDRRAARRGSRKYIAGGRGGRARKQCVAADSRRHVGERVTRRAHAAAARRRPATSGASSRARVRVTRLSTGERHQHLLLSAKLPYIKTITDDRLLHFKSAIT